MSLSICALHCLLLDGDGSTLCKVNLGSVSLRDDAWLVVCSELALQPANKATKASGSTLKTFNGYSLICD